MNVDKAEKTILKCKKIKLAFEVSVILLVTLQASNSLPVGAGALSDSVTCFWDCFLLLNCLILP